MNVTITDISNLGDVRVFPAGGSAVVSTQNWTGSTGTIANAAVVALGTGGAVTFTIDGFAAVDLIVDVNGFYASDFTDPAQEFVITTASTGPSIFALNGSLTCIRAVRSPSTGSPTARPA